MELGGTSQNILSPCQLNKPCGDHTSLISVVNIVHHFTQTNEIGSFGERQLNHESELISGSS